ncbi:MAG: chemotaxis protein CheX, partial [Myxococcota bacterium]|nr:chemotaxis protein CheX [Myxococcota bacterium]
KRRLRLGEALVRLGHLDALEVDALLEKFNADQAPFFGSDLDMPDLLRENTLAAFVLDFLPKIAMRVSRLHLKVANSDQESGGGFHDATASIVLRGSSGIRVSLSADRAFASKLMTGMIRIMSGNFDATPDDESDQEDLLGEFLSILAGHALGAFEQKGEKLAVEPPTYGNPPDGATAFSLVSPHGAAKIYLTGV